MILAYREIEELTLKAKPLGNPKERVPSPPCPCISRGQLRGHFSRPRRRYTHINLLQLSVINIGTEGIFHRIEINPVPISSDLHSVCNPTGAIVHEVFRPSAVASADSKKLFLKENKKL